MSVTTAKAYFERSDDPDATIDDVVELFTDDAVLKSPREGIFRGRDRVHEFFELNADYFAKGVHNVDRYYQDGDTVICEGTIAGKTSAGREYEGVGLVDVMDFDGEKIRELRVYLDYSGIASELPADEDVPDFRD